MIILIYVFWILNLSHFNFFIIIFTKNKWEKKEN